MELATSLLSLLQHLFAVAKVTVPTFFGLWIFFFLFFLAAIIFLL